MDIQSWPIITIIITIIVVWYIASSWDKWYPPVAPQATTQATSQAGQQNQQNDQSNFTSDGLKGLHLSEMQTRNNSWRTQPKKGNQLAGLFGVHFESHRRK